MKTTNLSFVATVARRWIPRSGEHRYDVCFRAMLCITRSLLYADDGRRFSKTHEVANVPTAAGAHRPEAFTDSGTGKRIQWGVHIGKRKGFLPFIERFDLTK